MKRIDVRAVGEAAIDCLAEDLANTYHWGDGRPLRQEFRRWYHRRLAEKKRWEAVARRVEEMILNGEITVEEEPGR